MSRTRLLCSVAVLVMALVGCAPLNVPVDLGTPVDLTSEELSGVWGRTDNEQGDPTRIWFGDAGEFSACNFPAPYVWDQSELHGDGSVSISGYFEVDRGRIYAGTDGAGRAGAPLILFPSEVDGVDVLRVQAGGDPDSSDIIDFVKNEKDVDLKDSC
ncbi:hypothetical protein [Myceligenerans xiligouense]|uniref:hypothetical protein n=1 Tax=Myceligenerans xiligouense TaxID=253184 RepID=UPI000F4EA385|nr:hypothetical protein [Myceligenerans xiligouense]